jgi:hypothetical protein
LRWGPEPEPPVRADTGGTTIPVERFRHAPLWAYGYQTPPAPGEKEHSELCRNPRSGFVAYVPVGSIKKGEDLLTTGGMRIVGNKIVQGKTTACGTGTSSRALGMACPRNS